MRASLVWRLPVIIASANLSYLVAWEYTAYEPVVSMWLSISLSLATSLSDYPGLAELVLNWGEWSATEAEQDVHHGSYTSYASLTLFLWL